MINKTISKIISIGLISLATQINAEDFYLSISRNKLEVDTTQRTRVYSLLETESLKEDWNKTIEQRGSNNDLSFNIDTSTNSKFFKVKSKYEPIEPLSNFQEFILPYEITQRGEGPGTMVSNDLQIVNYETNNINVNVTWEQIYNKYGGSAYDVNTPYSTTLIPGTNYLPFVFTWQCNDGGAQVTGNVNIEKIE